MREALSCAMLCVGRGWNATGRTEWLRYESAGTAVDCEPDCGCVGTCDSPWPLSLPQFGFCGEAKVLHLWAQEAVLLMISLSIVYNRRYICRAVGREI